jgi:hypothetical protein
MVSGIKESPDRDAAQGLFRQRHTAHSAAPEQPSFVLNQRKEF